MKNISKKIGVLSALIIFGIVIFAKYFFFRVGLDFTIFEYLGVTKRLNFLIGFLLMVLVLIVIPPIYRRALLAALNLAVAPSRKPHSDRPNLFAAIASVASVVVVGFALFAKYLAVRAVDDAFFLLGSLFVVLALSVFCSLAQFVINRASSLGLRKSVDLRLLRPRLRKLFQKHKPDTENCRRILAPLVLNFISFVVLSFAAFKFNKSNLFYGLDGSYMMELVREQMEWLTLQAGSSNNFLQSLGNVWFPFNSYLILGYAVSILNAGKVDPALSYTIFSSELFLATLSLGIYLCVRPIFAVAIAWAFCLACFPYIGLPAIYPILILVPQLATLWATGIFILILFWLIGKKNAFISCGCIVVVLLLTVNLLLSLSVATIEIAPVLAVFALFGFIYSENQNERLWKLIASGFVLTVLFATGCVSYLYGLLKYTAAYFFSDELLNDRMQLTFTSVLFTSRVGFIFFTLCLVGALIVALRGSGLSRVFAKATLFSINLILISGVICESFDIWHGPSPLYFEFLLWPLYAVFGAIALCLIGIYGLQIGTILIGMTRANIVVELIRDRSPAFYGSIVAILPWWLIFIPALLGQHDAKRANPYPPPQTPIVTELAKQIALKPGEIFRGRVGTFTGLRINGSVNWLTLHTTDYELIRRLGNDHRMVGLWYYDIPTLIEYNPLITPAFYLMTKNFLARRGDLQVRSAITVRNINQRILRMMGVRFLITDAPIADFAQLRESIPEHAPPLLYLYELDGVNVGQFSPRNAILRTNASDILTAMERSGFDPAIDIVVEDSLPKNLSPLANSRVTAEVGGLRISASSSGTSVILLPLEFSHCLEVKRISRAQSLPKLFRANLVLTGLLFDKKLDAVVSYFTGPFHNAACRLEDARDMQRLNVTAATSS